MFTIFVSGLVNVVHGYNRENFFCKFNDLYVLWSDLFFLCQRIFSNLIFRSTPTTFSWVLCWVILVGLIYVQLYQGKQPLDKEYLSDLDSSVWKRKHTSDRPGRIIYNIGQIFPLTCPTKRFSSIFIDKLLIQLKKGRTQIGHGQIGHGQILRVRHCCLRSLYGLVPANEPFIFFGK